MYNLPACGTYKGTTGDKWLLEYLFLSLYCSTDVPSGPFSERSKGLDWAITARPGAFPEASRPPDYPQALDRSPVLSPRNQLWRDMSTGTKLSIPMTADGSREAGLGVGCCNDRWKDDAVFPRQRAASAKPRTDSPVMSLISWRGCRRAVRWAEMWCCPRPVEKVGG